MCDLISRKMAIDQLHQSYNLLDAEQRLEDLPSAQPETHDKRTETHECDLINRQQAIDAVAKAKVGVFPHDAGINNSIKAIKALPSAQPQRKRGKWIPVDSFSAFGGDEAMWMANGNPVAFYYCSECKEQAYAGEDGESLLTDFCPLCGADMRGESDE